MQTSDGGNERCGGRVALGIGLFLGAQYAMALWRLSQSGGIDSKFSRVALEDYRGFLIAQNLHALAGYVLLGVVGWLLLFPLARVARRRFQKKWVPLGVGLLGAMGLHGYFMFRLAHSRPYFIGDATFGDWYYQILKLPPESWQPWVSGFAFEFLPNLGALAALLWWLGHSRTPGRLALGGLTLLLATVLFVHEHGIRRAPAGAGESAALRKNVLIIGSDSLRGDRLGYAGYRPTRSNGPAAQGVSPHIDRWAEQAVRFTECRTPIGSTLESGVSLMTSTYPHTHGLRQMFVPRGKVEAVRAEQHALAELLGEHGYDTAAIGDWCGGYYQLTPLGFDEVDVSSFDNFEVYVSQAVLMAHFVVPLYFDHPLGHWIFPRIRSFAQFVTPEVVTSRVQQRLRRRSRKDRPFFWHVFYSCNHLPFRSSSPYNQMFCDPGYDGPHATAVDFDINAFIGGTRVDSKESVMSRADVEQVRALYDGCTRQFDANFGSIIGALEDAGELENTVVILVSDHGDDLFGPGVTLGHGLSFNGRGPSYHVPLAVRVPGTHSREIPQQVRTIDVAPTVAGLLGLPAPAGWEGVDLSRWICGQDRPRSLPFYGETQFPFILPRVNGVERPVLPGMDDLTRVDPEFNHQFVLREEFRDPVVRAKQRCLRTADWKLVSTPDARGRRHYRLFHTATDPDCRTNLAADRPGVLAPMKKALDAWVEDRVETPIEEVFPQGEPTVVAGGG